MASIKLLDDKTDLSTIQMTDLDWDDDEYIDELLDRMLSHKYVSYWSSGGCYCIDNACNYL